jgi:hypothetical protein
MSKGRYPPSPHGCTHGYWVPCSECSEAIRAEYNKHPEWFPVEIRDTNGRYLGGPSEPAYAPGPRP